MQHLRTAEVAARIYQAIQRREKFSLVRMADTEANLLWAAKGILPKVQAMNPHVDPDTYPEQTKRLAAGIRKADMVGLPFSGPYANRARWRPLLEGGLQLYGWSPMATDLIEESIIGQYSERKWRATTNVCDCLVSYYLIIGGFFWGLLRDERLLLMNDNPEPIAEALGIGSYAPAVAGTPGARTHSGDGTALTVMRTVTVDGPGIDPFVDRAAECADEWDVALVGAAARKMAIVPELAERTGKVVLDMGKVLARLIDPHPVWEKTAELYAAEG